MEWKEIVVIIVHHSICDYSNKKYFRLSPILEVFMRRLVGDSVIMLLVCIKSMCLFL